MVEPKDINWNELSFALIPTKMMYFTSCQAGDSWKKGGLKPFGNISISPAACVLNYGQGLFEGMKVYYHQDGETLVMFRPQENAARLADGCRRLCIPPLPEEIFLDAVTQTAKANKEYVPPYRPNSSSQGALYVRPVIWGTGPILGVSPAPEFTFMVYCSPVGPYFKAGFQPIKLLINKDFHRAAPGATGGVKAIGNYTGGMLPAKMAKKEGFSEVLYLDAKEDKYIEEVGAANFFCIKGNTLYTPSLDGTILPGITRKSILKLAKEQLGMEVEEKKLLLTEALQADEAFASGTAAVISPIGSISLDGKEHLLNNGEVGPITKKLYDTLISIQHGLAPDPYNWVYKL